MSRPRAKAPAGEEGAPLWMVTFSDMMTLLLAFFILLFSFSVIDQHRFEEVMASMRVTFLGAEGVLEGAIEPAETELDDIERETISEMAITYEAIRDYIQEEELEEVMTVRLEERGVVLEIADALLFDSKKADLRPESLEALSYVADALGRINNQIIIEGHTDNLPINTFLFPSNWELSVGRAVAVARYLIEAKGLEPTRFMAVGFGEFHPVASNLTVEGRGKNRRVNIVISTLENDIFLGGEERDEPSS